MSGSDPRSAGVRDGSGARAGPEFYRTLERVSGELYYRALTVLPLDVREALDQAAASETSPTGRRILELIGRNLTTATDRQLLVCQDTGFPVYLLEVGEVDLSLGRAIGAIRAGVARTTREHHLRPNLVSPISRENTGDNTGTTAPVVHLESRPELGAAVRVRAMPKGSGSENMSAMAMLPLADGLAGVERFVLSTIADAGGKGCPPYIVGVGIGGTFDSVGYLAKKAVFRRLTERAVIPGAERFEERLLEKINRLGLGPMGLGGSVTAISVNAEWGETHISSLPVAVNVQCWRGERAEATITAAGVVQPEAEAP
jgi:tartrate/fumarate subfamily iron-sulfur-dependent hydro-lyase alpha chain